jgi:hypothetical protein
MHPTRNSVAFIFNHAGGRVMPGVRLMRVNKYGSREEVTDVSVNSRSSSNYSLEL